MSNQDDAKVRTTRWIWRGPALSVHALAFSAGVYLIGVPTDPLQLFVWLWLATIVRRQGSVAAPPRLPS